MSVASGDVKLKTMLPEQECNRARQPKEILKHSVPYISRNGKKTTVVSKHKGFNMDFSQQTVYATENVHLKKQMADQ